MKTNQLIPNVTVPEGTSGIWTVKKFEVTEQGAAVHNLREDIHGGHRHITPGIYTALMRAGDGYPVMSDTPAEKRDHVQAVSAAHDHCLVNGLGLGMVANAMLLKPQVTMVTVIEKSADVIALVGPHYKALYGQRFEVILADALEYKSPKGVRYGVVWHDIWDTISQDNLSDMRRLHHKYARRADWQGSWARELCF